MQQVKDLFNNYRILPTTSRRTERGDLITEFTERLNTERDGRKLLTVASVAFFLSPFNVGDVYTLLKKCQDARVFSACFWSYVKPKKNDANTYTRKVPSMQ